MQEIYPTEQEILSEEFLAKYKNLQPKWGFSGLGYVVYKRTYSREVPGENRTEEWHGNICTCILRKKKKLKTKRGFLRMRVLNKKKNLSPRSSGKKKNRRVE